MDNKKEFSALFVIYVWTDRGCLDKKGKKAEILSNDVSNSSKERKYLNNLAVCFFSIIFAQSFIAQTLFR